MGTELRLLEEKGVHTVLYKVEESCGHCERGRTKFVLLSHDLVELNWFIFFFF